MILNANLEQFKKWIIILRFNNVIKLFVFLKFYFMWALGENKGNLNAKIADNDADPLKNQPISIMVRYNVLPYF